MGPRLELAKSGGEASPYACFAPKIVIWGELVVA